MVIFDRIGWAYTLNQKPLFYANEEAVHTVVIDVIMLTSLFFMYATFDPMGSPGKMWDLFKDVRAIRTVDGNADGDFLTIGNLQGGLGG